MAAVGELAFFQQGGQGRLLDQLAAKADPFMEAHKVRRGIDVHPLAGGFQHGPQIGNDRALAVGAGDVHHRRQLVLGMVEAVQQALHPLERQIDQLRVKLPEPI